ncbi:MAG TPA: ABC transporter substrate-binding protein [Syntrophorhabdales bacterium]|nr:ABC transporter substrate-binding protein [Syntrophorhabdales bacterium]
MRKKVSLLFLVMLFVVGSLFCLGHTQVGAQSAAGMKSLKVGVISPQSGPVTFYGVSMLRGAELAVKNVNEKGTTGNGPGILVGKQRYKLEIVSYDDSADPAKSVAGMRKLAEMYKVPVILGPFGTPQVWACQEINVPLKILFNGLSASDQSRKKGNPLYIQERVPALYYGDPMAQACIDKGYKTAAVLTDINEAYQSWGKRFQQKFESLGGKVVSFESVDIKNTTDYHSIMTSMKTKNPDIIFISAYEEPTALATNHALDVGYKGKFLYTSEWGSKAEKIVGLDRIEGSMVQAMTHTFYRKYPNQDKKGIFTAFWKRYQETYKEDYAQPGVSVYDPALMFFRAMEISNSVTDAYAIRAACAKALQEGKLPLIFPNNDVLKNGLMVGAPELLLEIKGGQYTLVKELRVPKDILE